VRKVEVHKQSPEIINGLMTVTIAGLIVPSVIMLGKYWWPHVEPYIKWVKEGVLWAIAPKRTIVEYERDPEGRIIRTKEWKEPIQGRK